MRKRNGAMSLNSLKVANLKRACFDNVAIESYRWHIYQWQGYLNLLPVNHFSPLTFEGIEKSSNARARAGVNAASMEYYTLFYWTTSVSLFVRSIFI